MVGTLNPSGIAGKYDLIKQFPSGWWSVAESQAAEHQLKSFSSVMRRRDDDACSFRVLAGAPAPLWTGGCAAGTWTGVLQFVDRPPQRVCLDWPMNVWESGRVVMAVFRVSAFDVTVATVYLPPRGPTFPEAGRLAEELLHPITSKLILGREGVRMVVGDFNNTCDGIHAFRVWRLSGWELQVLMSRRFGLPARPTCKGSTAPDQIWLSPEAQRLICHVGFADLFPDHLVLAAKLQFPGALEKQLHWRIPDKLPWDHVDRTSLNRMWASRQPFSWSDDSTCDLERRCSELKPPFLMPSPRVIVAFPEAVGVVPPPVLFLVRFLRAFLREAEMVSR